MKKTIALFALVLCILAGLVSGSLALYTKDIDNIGNGSVVAKKFVLTAAGSDGYVANAPIAPTETVTAAFTVSNFEDAYITEVDMDLEITVTVKAIDGKGAIPYVRAELYDWEGTKVGTIENGVGVINFKADKAFTAKDAETLTFELRFYWESHDDDVEYQGPQYGNMYSVKVTGTQSV